MESTRDSSSYNLFNIKIFVIMTQPWQIKLAHLKESKKKAKKVKMQIHENDIKRKRK